jgi:hypothetical protein
MISVVLFIELWKEKGFVEDYMRGICLGSEEGVLEIFWDELGGNE